MYHIRETKTQSGARAVQVVEYVKRKVKVVKHIGSGRGEEEMESLKKVAESWVKRNTRQKTLFDKPEENRPDNIALLSQCEYLGIHQTFIYEILTKLLERFEFTSVGNQLLCDLVIIRLIEPASKLRSLELLREYFGINHRRQTFYECLPEFIGLKDTIEKLTVNRARQELDFNFSLVFYDVTTLYFESFEPDNLRKNGFSKDHKANQPQIVIGLMVSDQGFPIAYEVFPGNKFEGHTIVPVIEEFKTKHAIDTLTVVADAGMISLDNITALKARGLNYIVGARLGNLSLKLSNEISQTLNRRNGATTRIVTANGDLICSFSEKRYRKDKREMDKQIKKAEELLSGTTTTIKRAKFLKNVNKKITKLITA